MTKAIGNRQWAMGNGMYVMLRSHFARVLHEPRVRVRFAIRNTEKTGILA